MAKKRILILGFVVLTALTFLTVRGVDDTATDTPLSSFSRIEKFVNSNKHTQPENYEPVEVMPSYDSAAIIIDTALGAVYLNPRSLSFQFTAGGYIWSTTVNADGAALPLFFLEETASALIIESYNTNNPNFAVTKEYITKDTPVELEVTDRGFRAAVTFRKSQISIELVVEFKEDGISVRVPQNKIKEPGAFKLATLAVYPFFGAVREDAVPGYIFVPDGVGALVRYRTAVPSLIGNYKKDIYDRSISFNTVEDLNQYQTAGTRIYMPVFGFVHGVEQNGIFSEIVNGAEYANLNVYYPNFTLGYTTVFPQFVYRRTYNQPMNKAGDLITLMQEEANPVDVSLDYTVLSGPAASYVGMAQIYRCRLALKDKSPSPSVPLRLETIGIEKTPGVLFNKTIVMTEFSAFRDMIADLKSAGIANIHAVYGGFSNKGYTWSSPDYRKISSRLGKKSDLAALSAEVQALYLRVDYTKVSGKAQGYNHYRDLAKKINDQIYQYYSANDKKYLLKHNKTATLFKENTAYLKSYASGFAIDSLGYLLYNDFKSNTNVSDQIALYRELLSSETSPFALYGANRYLWEEIDAYFDFPMYSSQYLAFTDTVPFMAYLLRGKIDLFAAAANFYPYARDELLRLIDYGVYPSFIVTAASAQKLNKTDLAAIYSSQYSVLKPDIKTYYRFINDALSPVTTAVVIDREVPVPGLVVVTYDNGYRIVINYRHLPREYLGHSIAPKDYLVLGASA